MIMLTMIRQKLNLSQAELARRSSVGASTIRAIESGRLKPLPSQRKKIVDALEAAGCVLAGVNPFASIEDADADGLAVLVQTRW